MVGNGISWTINSSFAKVFADRNPRGWLAPFIKKIPAEKHWKNGWKSFRLKKGSLHQSLELIFFTPWKFNSSPLKISHPKRKVIFKPAFFRGYVKLRGCNNCESGFMHAQCSTVFLLGFLFGRIGTPKFVLEWDLVEVRWYVTCFFGGLELLKTIIFPAFCSC